MPTLWTIGHSTRSAGEFLAVLDSYGITALIDVRRFPGSRHMPQFGSAELERSLADRGIDYRWLPSLGGRRKALRESINTGWKNESFRGYADHIASEEFAAGLNELLTIADGMPAAIMCAELLWWRCHRRLIADVLTMLGNRVIRIRDAKLAEVHAISPPGRIVDGILTYAADGSDRLQVSRVGKGR